MILEQLAQQQGIPCTRAIDDDGLALEIGNRVYVRGHHQRDFRCMRLCHEYAQIGAAFHRAHHMIRLLKTDIVAVRATLAQFRELLRR